MAGAYTSLGDDVHALVFNPAGLARIRRIEFDLGFQQQRMSLDNKFFGTASEVDLRSSDLDHAAWAYPLPTYRGSLVLAAGVYRSYSGDIDILNRGFNTLSVTNDEYFLQQSGSIFSYNLGVGVDLSPVLSAGVNLYFLDGSSALAYKAFAPEGVVYESSGETPPPPLEP